MHEIEVKLKGPKVLEDALRRNRKYFYKKLDDIFQE